MKEVYFEIVTMLEKLHRLFLDVIKAELDRLNIQDISNVQALILYNIGKDQITVGELTQRGYYLGSNVSYNLRKMLLNNYIVQVPSPHDRRSTYIKASDKGLKLFTCLDNQLPKQVQALAKKGLEEKNLQDLLSSLRKLENFWKEWIVRF